MKMTEKKKRKEDTDQQQPSSCTLCDKETSELHHFYRITPKYEDWVCNECIVKRGLKTEKEVMDRLREIEGKGDIKIAGLEQIIDSLDDFQLNCLKAYIYFNKDSKKVSMCDIYGTCIHFKGYWNQVPCDDCLRNPFVPGKIDYYEKKKPERKSIMDFMLEKYRDIIETKPEGEQSKSTSCKEPDSQELSNWDKKVIKAFSNIRDYITVHGLTSMTNEEKYKIYELQDLLRKRKGTFEKPISLSEATKKLDDYSNEMKEKVRQSNERDYKELEDHPVLVKIDNSKGPFEIEFIGPEEPTREGNLLGESLRSETPNCNECKLYYTYENLMAGKEVKKCRDRLTPDSCNRFKPKEVWYLKFNYYEIRFSKECEYEIECFEDEDGYQVELEYKFPQLKDNMYFDGFDDIFLLREVLETNIAEINLLKIKYKISDKK
jgi:hypothetical protein